MKRFICTLQAHRPETEAKFQHLDVHTLRISPPIRIFWARNEQEARAHGLRLWWHEVLINLAADDISISEYDA